MRTDGHDRDLRILVAAVGLSTLGDHAALTALLLIVHEATGSALLVAGLLLGLWGPVVALGGVAGTLVDRVETVRLLALAAGAQAVLAGTMAILGEPIVLVLMVPLLGAGIAVAQPAEFALVPAVAGRRSPAVAGGRVETARYAGMALGPLVGGSLAGIGHARGALMLDAATFALVAVAVTLMRARRHPAARDPRTGRPRARDGVAALARDRVLAITLAGTVASLLVVSATIVALVAFAHDVLDIGAAGYGALVGVWTAGMVAGALAGARCVPPAGYAVAALSAVVVQGLGILSGAAAAAVWVVVAGHLVGGAAQGMRNVLVRALIHERIAPALHGRAFAAYNAARNAAELAALMAGAALVGLAGARATLVVAGAGCAAIGLVALGVMRTRAGVARRAGGVRAAGAAP